MHRVFTLDFQGFDEAVRGLGEGETTEIEVSALLCGKHSRQVCMPYMHGCLAGIKLPNPAHSEHKC